MGALLSADSRPRPLSLFDGLPKPVLPPRSPAELRDEIVRTACRAYWHTPALRAAAHQVLWAQQDEEDEAAGIVRPTRTHGPAHRAWLTAHPSHGARQEAGRYAHAALEDALLVATADIVLAEDVTGAAMLAGLDDALEGVLALAAEDETHGARKGVGSGRMRRMRKTLFEGLRTAQPEAIAPTLAQTRRPAADHVWRHHAVIREAPAAVAALPTPPIDEPTAADLEGPSDADLLDDDDTTILLASLAPQYGNEWDR